jgi:hypothetical protein
VGNTSKAKIVAIVGSSRFKQFHQGHAQRLTLKGYVVLGYGFFHHVDARPITDDEKRMLDALTLTKVEMADEVLVVDVNGYVGESTKRAIEFATQLGKPVTYTRDEQREHA